jgi:hypothetical protein
MCHDFHKLERKTDMKTALDRITVFRSLITKQLTRVGASVYAHEIALAETLNLDPETIPTTINLAAQEWAQRFRHRRPPTAPRPDAPPKRKPGPKPKPKPIRNPLDTPSMRIALYREAKATELRNQGRTWRDIARELKIGPEGARSAFARATRRRRESAAYDAGAPEAKPDQTSCDPLARFAEFVAFVRHHQRVSTVSETVSKNPETVTTS